MALGLKREKGRVEEQFHKCFLHPADRGTVSREQESDLSTVS